VVVSKAETGEGHSEEGWERDNGVNVDALGNGRCAVYGTKGVVTGVRGGEEADEEAGDESRSSSMSSGSKGPCCWSCSCCGCW
jgi:hypothetical protein